MRTFSLPRALLAFALAGVPAFAAAQAVSDFIFDDEDGHLVLRFTGVSPHALSERQRDEIANSEFSNMVHDRLKADAIFEVEPVDAHWAHAMSPLIEAFVRENETRFLDVDVECRSASCRLILEHELTHGIAAHEALVPVAQRVIDSFIANHQNSFEPGFMIAAHYQEPDTPYIKVYLSRSSD